jgi:hypothetical protein
MPHKKITTTKALNELTVPPSTLAYAHMKLQITVHRNIDQTWPCDIIPRKSPQPPPIESRPIAVKRAR